MDFIITHYHGEAKVNDINNDHTYTTLQGKTFKLVTIENLLLKISCYA